ncbi:ParB N-terminal domain-containing protein [Mesorhizobium sp. LNJC394B00]|uniref:ParB N-terminal domain-containing protein n=1 Tax=Mesorhizobium sp. LNJC394B00 TaxID=1287274 RepID=UPI0012EBA424|nr:ParB N-terminal domain-containing protein [Mesorhizobium sp. LNJC394B00]
MSTITGPAFQLQSNHEDAIAMDAMNPQIDDRVTIRLDGLVMDPATQIRQETNAATVKQYRDAMRAGAVFTPITVAPVDPQDPDKGFVLIDGWHRVTAVQALGGATIDAVVVTGATPNEYRWIAAEKNRTHGLRLTSADKREVFRAYVQAGRHRMENRGRRVKSAREMARDLQGIVSDRRIPVWMQQDFPKVYRAMRAGGLEKNPGSDFGRKDRDVIHAELATTALVQFKASFSAIRSKEQQQALLVEITRAAQDVAKVATGGRELPAVIPEDF